MLVRHQILLRRAQSRGVRTVGRAFCRRGLAAIASSALLNIAMHTSFYRIATDVRPPPFDQTHEDRATSSAVPLPTASSTSTSEQSDARMSTPLISTSAVPFSPQEVRALVFPLIPYVQPNSTLPGTGSGSSVTLQSISVPEVMRQLPKPLRSYLEKYQRPASFSVSAAATELKCDVSKATPYIDSDAMMKAVASVVSHGMTAYLVDHFPEEVVVVTPGGRLARNKAAASPDEKREESLSLSPSANTAVETNSRDNAPLEDKIDDAAFASSTAASVFTPTDTAAAPRSRKPEKVLGSGAGIRFHAGGTAPPPPPQPLGPSQRYGNSVGTPSFFGAAPVGSIGVPSLPSSTSALGKTENDLHSDASAAPLRTTIQIMDVLVEYIPTFYVSIEEVEPMLPSSVQQLYKAMTLRFFLKRFKHYVDLRLAHNTAEVRLRQTFDHPKRGMADTRYRLGGMGSVESLFNGNQLSRPPRNSEANLIGLIAPHVPKTFTPLADVLQEIAPIVSRHPAFDSRLGVTGLLGKYPEYFQVVDGRLRSRPYRVAPNSLKEFDQDSSPLPMIFAKVWAFVEKAAAGKNYAEPSEKAAAMVSTGRLYSLLSTQEKTLVKQQCRSFPTFLRLHGKALVVSVDKMRVYKFAPEYEACADTLMDERLRMNSLDPNDPILKIPAEMAPDSNAEWAVRELYDALPLMQCAELDEMLSLVPPAVRDALPKALSDVQALLQQYGDYFSIWPYPDDESVIVVQRAKVEEPVLDTAEIVRMVVPLIPQGGTTLPSLRTRVPLPLQRYFYRHGTIATLGAMKDIFAIAGDRIVRLV